MHPSEFWGRRIIFPSCKFVVAFTPFLDGGWFQLEALTAFLLTTREHRIIYPYSCALPKYKLWNVNGIFTPNIFMICSWTSSLYFLIITQFQKIWRWFAPPAPQSPTRLTLDGFWIQLKSGHVSDPVETLCDRHIFSQLSLKNITFPSLSHFFHVIRAS